MTILTTVAAVDAQSDSRATINANFAKRHGYDLVTKATADSPYTVPSTDYDKATILNADSGSIVVNLPTAVGLGGHTFLFIRTDANSSYSVTLTPASVSPSETIGGDSTKTISIESSVRIISDGSDWWVISEV